VVIGASGSALADLVFCQPGTRVLELIPSDHVVSYWYTVADSGGLRYGYLVGESETHRAAGTPGPSLADFRVDEDQFRLALASTLEGLPQPA
jgi:capsular polysaccharide biosynthesis protein